MAAADNQNSAPNPIDEEAPKTGIFRRIGEHVQGKTVGGLVEMVPLLVTIVVVTVIVGWADRFVIPLASNIWPPLGSIPGIGIVTGCIIFYLVGLLISTRFGRNVMDFKDTFFRYIPVVGTIFGVARQATTSMTSQFSFTRAVFLEWTQPGVVSLGFVTGQAFRDKMSADNDEQPQSMVIVYIPTVPNPTSGNLALVMEDDLIETDLSVEDAMKLVFSGGIVLPDSLSFARLARERSKDEIIDRFIIDNK